MLSIFYIVPFELDGMMWSNVEKGSKFKKENPEFYKLFSLDSESDLSEDPVMAKGDGGKTGKSRGKEIRPTKIKIDKNFFDGRDKKECIWCKMLI